MVASSLGTGHGHPHFAGELAIHGPQPGSPLPPTSLVTAMCRWIESDESIQIDFLAWIESKLFSAIGMLYSALLMFITVHKQKWNRIMTCFSANDSSALLADCTNSRNNATMLHPSVVVCDVCIVAKQWIQEQKLLLTDCSKSHTWNRGVPKWMTLTFI